MKYPADWIKRKGKEKISVMTCYDATYAKLIEKTSIDSILVGDTLGMVVQGKSSTIPVTTDEIIYHSTMVRRGAPGKFTIVDMPFSSYHIDITSALNNCVNVFRQTDASALKLETNSPFVIPLIKQLVMMGIPVMGHIGLTPQNFLTHGGYRVQGRNESEGTQMRNLAIELQNAGCFGLLLELVEPSLAQIITEETSIPTIGIGSGPSTDGQVLVLQDLLGLDPYFTPKHAKRYAQMGNEAMKAFDDFDKEVKSGIFPTKP